MVSHNRNPLEHADATKEAKELPCPLPIIIVRHTVECPKEAFLACEKMIICKISIEDIAIALFAAYYTLICSIVVVVVICFAH